MPRSGHYDANDATKASTECDGQKWPLWVALSSVSESEITGSCPKQSNNDDPAERIGYGNLSAKNDGVASIVVATDVGHEVILAAFG